MIDEVAAGEDAPSGRLGPEETRALQGLVATAVVDERGIFRTASERWCALVGRSAGQVIGSRWDEILGPEVAGIDLGIPGPGSAAIRRFECRIAAWGATCGPVDFEMAPVGGGGDTAGWLLVARHGGHAVPGDAERRLEESRRQLLRIFDDSADAVTVLNRDGSWRAARSGGRNLLGIPDDLTGEGPAATGDPMSMVHPDDRESVRRAIDELSRRADHSFGDRFEFRVRGAGGHWLWLETRGVNMVDDPALGGIVLHSRDVTESHEAAEALSSMASRLTSLVSNLFVGVMMADEHDELIFANRAASEMFGLGGEPERLIRMNGGMLSAHLQRLHRDLHALDRIGEIVGRRQVVMEERVELTNGRTLARSFVPILDDGAYRGHLWLYRDLTDEIAVAAEREYLLRMEKEQNARLTELDSLKSDLVASVSHELRTPLTSIVSFTHLLRDGLGTDGVADQAEFLDIITRNTDRLLRLVDDLLLLDRLESNSLQVSNEWVDFPSLVEIAVSSIRPAAKEKGVTLVSESEPGPPLVGDVDRLGQLIDNLLANAVKFTPAKGQVRTEVSRTADGWRLVVSDTGIGIPMDEQHELFQRFYRASNARQASASGSGLGLLIALRITELHQGTIDVKSVEGRGTTVNVELRGAARPSLPPSPLAERSI